MQIRLLVAGVLMLGLGGQRGGPLPSSPLVQAQHERLSTISGQIRTADDALPVHRARVVLTWSDGAIGPVFTDDNGVFTLQGPATAQYTLHVTRSGFVPLHLEHVPTTSGDAWDIRLAVAAVLTGRVVAPSGMPETRREVRLRQVVAGSRSSPRDVARTETNDLGAFRFGGLAAGQYELALGGVTMAMSFDGGVAQANLVVNSTDRSPKQIAPVTLRTGEQVDLELQSDFDPASISGTLSTSSIAITGSISMNLVMVTDDGDSLSALPRAAGPRQGSIEGRISGAEGLPVALAQVTAVPLGSGRSTTTHSDSNGAYELANLAPGRYRVTVSKPGFMRWAYGQVDAGQAGRVVVLRPNGQARKIDVTLPRGGVVSGKVIDAFGVPVEGVTLQLLEPRAAGVRQQLLPVGGITAKSDDRGEYRLAGIEPGWYFVRATDDTPASAPLLVDSPGRTTFLPGQDAPDAALALPVDVGLDAVGADIVFAPGASARVSGEVFDLNGNAFNGEVTLATSTKSASPLLESRKTHAVDGQFEFPGVPPGDYVVQAVESSSRISIRSSNRSSGIIGLSPARDAETSFGAAFVTVASTAGDPPPVTIAMSQGHTLRGHIVVEGGATGLDPPNLTLTAVPADLDLTPRAGTPRPTARVLSDRTMEITNVVGPIRLTLSTRADAEWWLKRVRVNGVDIGDDPISLSRFAPGDIDVEIVLARTAATISGRVVTSGRQPAGGGSVMVFSTDPEDWYERSRYVRAAEAGEDGQFSIGGLAPGDYWMVALETTLPSADRLTSDFLRRLASFATHVSLAEAQHRQTELRPMKTPR